MNALGPLFTRPVRATSLEAFETIKAKGLLSRQRLRVYAHLWEHGPLTGSEVDRALASPGQVRTSYHKRLPELLRLGVVREVGTRPCSVTGNACIAWDVTDALPVAPVEPTRPSDSDLRSAADALAFGPTSSQGIDRVVAWLRFKLEARS